ncbi:MAG: TolC family protein [Phycisphaerae bacterium]|nr:TolC family protein [Phycisphaerae bacterium]
MRVFFLIAALLPAALSAQSTTAAPPRPISLDEAIRLARQNSPAMISARNTIRQNDATVRTRQSNFLPTVSGSLGGSRAGGGESTDGQGRPITISGGDWSFSRGLNFNLNLWDSGERLHNLRAARANVVAAEANEEGQRFTVAYSVAQQYYAALAARESRAAAEAALTEAQQNLRAAVARIAAGAATRSDSLRSVIAVGNQQLALLTAESDLENANAALTRLVGTPFLVTAIESDTGVIVPVAATAAELTAMLDAIPTIRAARAALDAARSSSLAAKTAYYPDISLSYSMRQSAVSNGFDFGLGSPSPARTDPQCTGAGAVCEWESRSKWTNSLGFSVSIPLFQGLGREETILRNNLAEVNANASLRDARLLAQQQLTQYLGQLRLAQARIAIQQASLEAALEDLRVQQQRYSLGASTQLELLTTQTQLNSARYNLVNARYQVRIARAQLEQLLGREIR